MLQQSIIERFSLAAAFHFIQHRNHQEKVKGTKAEVSHFLVRARMLRKQSQAGACCRFRIQNLYVLQTAAATTNT